MPDLPLPLNATDITTLVQQTFRLMDDLYSERIGGALLGDVFYIGNDDILAVNTGDGLTKEGNILAVDVSTTGGLTFSSGGLSVKPKTGGGLTVDVNGLSFNGLYTGKIWDGITATLYSVGWNNSIPSTKYSIVDGTELAPTTAGKVSIHAEKFTSTDYATSPYDACAEFVIKKVSGSTCASGVRGMGIAAGGTNEVHGVHAHVENQYTGAYNAAGPGIWGGFSLVYNPVACTELMTACGWEVDMLNQHASTRKTNSWAPPVSMAYFALNGVQYTQNFAYAVGQISSDGGTTYNTFDTGFICAPDSITHDYECIYLCGSAAAAREYAGIRMAHYMSCGLDTTAATFSAAAVRLADQQYISMNEKNAMYANGVSLVIGGGFNEIYCDAPISIRDGFGMPSGAGAGKVLTSDADGVGTWQAAVGGGTMSNLVEDLTPELGGVLDLKGQYIKNTVKTGDNYFYQFSASPGAGNHNILLVDGGTNGSGILRVQYQQIDDYTIQLEHNGTDGWVNVGTGRLWLYAATGSKVSLNSQFDLYGHYITNDVADSGNYYLLFSAGADSSHYNAIVASGGASGIGMVEAQHNVSATNIIQMYHNGTDGHIVSVAGDIHLEPAGGDVISSGNVQMAGFKMATGAGAGKVLTSDGSGIGTWSAAAGGGLANVVEDTSPELGGHLDLKGNYIDNTTADAGNYQLFFTGAADSSHYNLVTVSGGANGTGLICTQWKTSATAVIQMYHNGTDGHITTLGGDLHLEPAGGDTYVTGTLRSDSTVYASGGNSGNWNTAYGWGNHASAGYLTEVRLDDSPQLGGNLDMNGAFIVGYHDGSYNVVHAIGQDSSHIGAIDAWYGTAMARGIGMYHNNTDGYMETTYGAIRLNSATGNIYVNNALVSYGANDSGGAGYKVMRVPN
jgi:hypothetical protein